MGGLVEDLLLLAELDRGRPLRAEPVDLHRVCTNAVDDSNAVPHDHHLVLEAGPPVVVVGDGERLAQVAHNLVRNALAHTPPGTEVTVSTGVTRSPWATSRCPTTGPGSRPGVAGRVFDRFYQGDPSALRLGHRPRPGHRPGHRGGPARERGGDHVPAGRGDHPGQDPAGRLPRRGTGRPSGARALTAIALRPRAPRHRARWRASRWPRRPRRRDPSRPRHPHRRAA